MSAEGANNWVTGFVSFFSNLGHMDLVALVVVMTVVMNGGCDGTDGDGDGRNERCDAVSDQIEIGPVAVGWWLGAHLSLASGQQRSPVPCCTWC